MRRGRSKVWDCFGPIFNDENKEIANFVACKMCYCVYKYNKNALSNLVNHKCYIEAKNENTGIEIDVNQETKKKCTEVLTEWVVGDIRPYALVQDRGLMEFSKLMLAVGHKHGPNVNIANLLPHPTTVYRNVEQRYQIHFKNLKNDITEDMFIE